MDLKGFSNRLRDAAFHKGIARPTDLAEKLRANGYGITLSAVQKHWYSRMIPGAENLLAYAKALSTSVDWLLTGQEPPRPNLIELQELLSRLYVEHGGHLTPPDETTQEIDKIIADLSPEQKRMALEALRLLASVKKPDT